MLTEEMQCGMGQGQGEQEQQLRSELSMEKAQLRRQHERELKALSDKMADEQVQQITCTCTAS